MTFFTRMWGCQLYFSRQKLLLLIKWVHNDFMYVCQICWNEKYKDLEQVCAEVDTNTRL